jgi:hypothetical protein
MPKAPEDAGASDVKGSTLIDFAQKYIETGATILSDKYR